MYNGRLWAVFSSNHLHSPKIESIEKSMVYIVSIDLFAGELIHGF
jgi:hypothetical protein